MFCPGTTVSEPEEEWGEVGDAGEGAGGGEMGTGRRKGVGEEGGRGTRGGRNGVGVSEMAYGGSSSMSSIQ